MSSSLLSDDETAAGADKWRWRPLGECIERPDYGVTASATHVAVGPRFVRITDIQEGEVNWQTVPYCTASEAEIRQKTLSPSDILVARIGATTGKALLVRECPELAVFASYLIRLRTIPEVLDSRFLSYFMRTAAYTEHIGKHKDDRLKGGVNIPVLRALLVPVPPLDVQVAISDVLDTVRSALRVQNGIQGVLNELLQSLQNRLMGEQLAVDNLDLGALSIRQLSRGVS